jgi:hypothetical protein
LIEELNEIRDSFEKAFDKSTSYKNMVGNTPSFGHCAIVAQILKERFGGEIFSCNVLGNPHRYNFFNGNYVDLTSDQFGMGRVSISKTPLYEGCRHRLVKCGISKELNNRIQMFRAKI